MKFKIFAYFIFIVICIFFSLYIHFPGKTASNYMVQQFSQINSHLKLQIEDLTPCVPLGIKTESIQVSYAGTPKITLENFRFFFDLTTLFGKDLKGRFKTHAFDGIMAGNIQVSKETPRDFGIETRLENLDLKHIHLGKSLSDGNVSGILNGRVTAKFKEGQLYKNDGNLKFADLVLQFPKTLFSVEHYSFSTGDLKFAMVGKNIIKIEEFTMKGRQADIHSSGEIHVAGNLQQSRLNIKARVVLYPLFFMNAGDSVPIDVSKGDSENATIGLRIGGTIQNPTISIDPGS